MTCCGKKTKNKIVPDGKMLKDYEHPDIQISLLRKGKNIVKGYTALAIGKKYEFADGRVRKCQKCIWNYWIHRRLFCSLWLRRFAATLWPDPIAFVPNRAREKDEDCPKGYWKLKELPEEAVKKE